MSKLLALIIFILFSFTLHTNAQELPSVENIPDWVPTQYHQLFRKREDSSASMSKMLNNIPAFLRKEPGPAFALIAGVSTYPKMRHAKNRDLAPARVDVENLSAYLAGDPENFDEVVVLLDEHMTLANLRYFLTDYFPARLEKTPRSRFVFAYSGHGITTRHNRGYLLTQEAQSFADRSTRARISLEELRAAFRPILDEGHQVLILINACYGSSFHTEVPESFGNEDEDWMEPAFVDQTILWEGAHAISAGGTNQESFHLQSYGAGSVFFEALLKGLDGRADSSPRDGVISINELRTFLPYAVGRVMGQRQIPVTSDLRRDISAGGFFFLDRRNLREAGLLPDLDLRNLLPFGGGEEAASLPPPPPLLTTAFDLPVDAWTSGQPGTSSSTFRECPDCPEMSVLPADHFEIGSASGPENLRFGRRIDFEKPFAMARHEVSVREWRAFTAAKDYRITHACGDVSNSFRPRDDLDWQRPGFPQTDDHPVVCIGWQDAKAYADWISALTGASYRLPTEAEWEYAAWSANTAKHSWGRDDSAVQCAHANGADRDVTTALPDETVAPCSDGYAFTAPVDSPEFPENTFRLRHMIGNVQEWTADCYIETLAQIPADGSETPVEHCDNGRTIRGGAWAMSPRRLHPSARLMLGATKPMNFVGFRLVRTLHSQ